MFGTDADVIADVDTPELEVRGCRCGEPVPSPYDSSSGLRPGGWCFVPRYIRVCFPTTRTPTLEVGRGWGVGVCVGVPANRENGTRDTAIRGVKVRGKGYLLSRGVDAIYRESNAEVLAR